MMLKYCVVSILLSLLKISNNSLVFQYLTSSPNNCSMQACKTMITNMVILFLEKISDQVRRSFKWQCKVTPKAYEECALQECSDEVSTRYYFYNGRGPAGKHLHQETLT